MKTSSYFRISIYLTFICLLIFEPLQFQAAGSALAKAPSAPECWNSQEKISFTGEILTDQPQVMERISTYEIHDDDTVNPNHLLTGLPYYSSLTWIGSTDVEWLVLDGNFSYYEIDDINHSVTFYGLQDWLHIIYRTHNFVQRPTDQIRFCVIGQNPESWSTNVRVLYPGNYQLQSATPAGYSVPAPGEIKWTLGSITDFQVDVYFAGLGPDRPLLDLPVDYQGRAEGSSTSFGKAFNNRITSKFDHRYPDYSLDSKFLPYNGIELDDPPKVNCTYGFNCYDGHDGYDIDDRCPAQAPCSDPKAVYPAADGDIVQNLTGWQDVLGCRITIDHGNGWTTLYGHLKDSQTGHACDGILIKSGHVTRLQKIGIIAGSGSGGGGDAHAHLHFVVKNNNRKSDPSGWEPNPSVFPDPWAGHTNGTASYPMWMYSIRSTQAFDPGSGGQLASPTHQVLATIPPGFYTEQLMFNLSNEPVANATPLVNTGHSFSLSAMDNSGQVVHQLNQEITLEVNFSLTDLTGINTDTLSIYYWNPDSNRWVPLQTNIDWDAYTATAQVDHLSIFALLGRTENVLFLPTVNRGR